MRKPLFAFALAMSLVPTTSDADDEVPAKPEKPKTSAASAPQAPPRCERRKPGLGGARLGGASATAAREGSTVALVRWGAATIAYVADEDDESVHTIELETGKVRASTRVGARPSQALVLADGRVAVALRGEDRLVVLEPTVDASAPLDKLCSIAVASEPVGLAMTPDDETLLVTSAWGKRLAAFDATSLAPRFDVGLPREPRAVVVDAEGQRAFVAHVVGARMSVVDLADAHEVRNVDLSVKRGTVSGVDAEQQGGCQGFALAKSVSIEDTAPLGEKPAVHGKAPPPPARAPARPAKPPAEPTPERPAVAEKPPTPSTGFARPRGRIFAPMVTVDPGNRATVSSGYGAGPGRPAEVPMVSVVDAAAERAITTSVLGEATHRHRDCLLPRSAVYVPSRTSILVTCLGIDDLVELDARGADPSRLERARWSVPAGPTGVAYDPAKRRAAVWSQFDRALSIVDVDRRDSSGRIVRVPSRAGSKVTAQLARGRTLFHTTGDRRISRDGRACASCHPDGREDALTWATPDGKRQTIMLAGRLSHGEPFSWNGNNPTLREHVEHTFQRLEGKGFAGAAAEADLAALLAYVESMPAPRSAAPHNADLVSRGKTLFFDEAQGCATCHVGGAGVDRTRHQVDAKGSVSGGRAAQGIDTPSLRFVSGTAPYFHDGRFETLDDLLASRDHAMGRTMQLGRADRVALIAFMETL